MNFKCYDITVRNWRYLSENVAVETTASTTWIGMRVFDETSFYK